MGLWIGQIRCLRVKLHWAYSCRILASIFRPPSHERFPVEVTNCRFVLARSAWTEWMMNEVVVVYRGGGMRQLPLAWPQFCVGLRITSKFNQSSCTSTKENVMGRLAYMWQFIFFWNLIGTVLSMKHQAQLKENTVLFMEDPLQYRLGKLLTHTHEIQTRSLTYTQSSNSWNV